MRYCLVFRKGKLSYSTCKLLWESNYFIDILKEYADYHKLDAHVVIKDWLNEVQQNEFEQTNKTEYEEHWVKDDYILPDRYFVDDFTLEEYETAMAQSKAERIAMFDVLKE